MDKIVIFEKRSMKATSISQLLDILRSKLDSADIPYGYTEVVENLIDDLKIKKSNGVTLDRYEEYISSESAKVLALMGMTKYVDKIDFSSPRSELLQIIVNNPRVLDKVMEYFSENDKVLTSYDQLSIILSNPTEYMVNRFELTSYQYSVIALVTKKYDLIPWDKVSRFDKLHLASSDDKFIEKENMILWDTEWEYFYLVFFMKKNRWKFLKNHINITYKRILYGM